MSHEPADSAETKRSDPPPKVEHEALALQYRIVEAIERLAAAIEKMNEIVAAKLARESYGAIITPGEDYDPNADISDLFASTPEGMFDDVEWE